MIPLILRNLRAVVFPNNSLGPPAPPPPSHEEALALRQKAAIDLLSIIPGPIYRKLFSPDAANAAEGNVASVAQVEDILDCVGDKQINKYLIYGILECFIVKLVPEMAEKTPSELLFDRGVGLQEEAR